MQAVDAAEKKKKEEPVPKKERNKKGRSNQLPSTWLSQRAAAEGYDCAGLRRACTRESNGGGNGCIFDPNSASITADRVPIMLRRGGLRQRQGEQPNERGAPPTK